MIEQIKQMVDFPLRVFDMFTKNGFYAIPFIGCALWLVTTENSRQQMFASKILFPCAIGSAFLISPLFSIIGHNQLDTRIIRFWWTLPFGIVVLYCVIELLFSCQKSSKRIIFVGIVLCGLLTCGRQQNETFPKVEQKWPWTRADNLYKVPETVREICDIIDSDNDDVTCYAALPSELSQYVRIYNASIVMPYSGLGEELYNDSYVAINSDTINFDFLGSVGQKNHLDYIVIDTAKVPHNMQYFSNYEKLSVVQDSKTIYIIYRHRGDW